VAIRAVLVGLADASRIDPAVMVAADALKVRSVDPSSIGQIGVRMDRK
jgi:hypothetical protein